MDWKAALALVKTQQQLLNDLLREPNSSEQVVAACPAPFVAAVKRRLVSPAADLFISSPKDLLSPSASVPILLQTADDDGTPSVAGSSAPDADDIVGTPCPATAATLLPAAGEEHVTVQEDQSDIHDWAPHPLDSATIQFDNAESFVDAVLGRPLLAEKLLSDDACDVLGFSLLVDERKIRAAGECEEDVLWTSLTVQAAIEWAKLEVRCAAEHIILDSVSAQIETLDALRRRLLHTCSAELQEAIRHAGTFHRVAPREGKLHAGGAVH